MKATPTIPGTVATRAMTMKRTRLPRRSESAESTTAPMMPARSITPPMMPASVELKPRGLRICSSQVVTPLKALMTRKATPSMTRNGLTVRACLRPSSMSARSSMPAGHGGVAGRSRASARNATAVTAANRP